MEQYIIREIKPKDFKKLAELRNKLLTHDSFSVLGELFLKQFYFPQFYYSPDGFVLVSQNFKGELNGYVAGSYNFNQQKKYLNLKLVAGLLVTFINKPFKFIKFIRRATASPNIEYDLSKHGKLASMAVCEGSQGKGIGSKLTHELLNRLKLQNIKKCYLYCRSDNISALILYKKIGFSESYNYQINNKDVFIMIKDI